MKRFHHIFPIFVIWTCFLLTAETQARVITLRSTGPNAQDDGEWTNQNGDPWSTELGDVNDATYVKTTGRWRQLYSDIQSAGLPAEAVIDSVTVYIRARQTTGNEGVDYGVRCYDPANGWIDVVCDTAYPGTSWTDYSCVWTTNPCTGNSWKVSEVDQLIGYLISRPSGRWRGEMRVAEMWFDVNYTLPTLMVNSNYATVDGDYQITAYATFDGDDNGNSSTNFEICTDSTCSSATLVCSGVTGASPRTCVISGLQPATDYWIRITHTDPDGVKGTNPEIIGPYTTTHTSLTVGSNLANVDSDTQITVMAPFAGDENGNSFTDFEICTDSACTSPSTVCAGVTGVSPRKCVVSGLQQNTTYWFRITHTDPDGVNGTNPEIIGPYTTTNNRVIPDAGTGTVDSTVQITVSVTFGGDANGNSSTDFERCTDSACTAPVMACSGVTGASPRSCVDDTLTPGTSYWYRITFNDPDGVNTSNAPNPQIIGPFTTPADNTPPLFSGIQVAFDTGKKGTVQIEFNSASDSSPPIRYNVYYNLSVSWNATDWTLNNVIYDISTQPGDTYDLKAYLTGLVDGEEYVIGVRAEDAGGNEDTNTVTAVVIPAHRCMDFKGYHMVADGLMPSPPNNTPSAVFGDDVGGALYVYIWVSTGLGFNPPFRGYYKKPTVIEPGRAYWIYNWVPGNKLDDDYGTRNTNNQTTVDLAPGWNMIANPYHKNIKLADVIVTKLNEPGAGDYTFDQAVANGWLVGAVYWWNGSGYSWRAYNDLPPAKLKPWIGYWLYQADDTVQLQLKFNRPRGR